MLQIEKYLLLNSYYLSLQAAFFLGYIFTSYTVAHRGFVKFSIENFFVKNSTPIILFILPLVSPFIALSNQCFWWFLLIAFIINVLLTLRAGKMIDIISPGNPGSIALMVPIMATAFVNPLVVIIYLIFY